MHKSSVSIYFFLSCEWWRAGSQLAFESRAFHAVLSYAKALTASSLRFSSVHVAETIEAGWCSYFSKSVTFETLLAVCKCKKKPLNDKFNTSEWEVRRFRFEEEILSKKSYIPCFFLRTFLPVWFTIMSCKKGIWMRCVCKDDYTFYYLRLLLLRLFFVSLRIELRLIVELCLA